MHFWEAHEQLHLFRKMKRIVLGGRQVCRNMMERTFTCSFACKTRSKRGGALQKDARSLYVQYHLHEQPPSFVGKRKIITCKMLSNVEKQDWNQAGGRPFACLWSLWSHTKSNRPLIWWLRPWKSSPPSEEDVRGRAWSFSRQREGSFNSQHQDVWIKDKPSGDCHILQAYTATCEQRFFRLSGNFNYLYWVPWFEVLQVNLSRSHSEWCQFHLPNGARLQRCRHLWPQSAFLW